MEWVAPQQQHCHGTSPKSPKNLFMWPPPQRLIDPPDARGTGGQPPRRVHRYNPLRHGGRGRRRVKRFHERCTLSRSRAQRSHFVFQTVPVPVASSPSLKYKPCKPPPPPYPFPHTRGWPRGPARLWSRISIPRLPTNPGGEGMDDVWGVQSQGVVGTR